MAFNLGQQIAVEEGIKKLLLENGIRGDVVISVSNGRVDMETREEHEEEMLEYLKYEFDLIFKEDCPSCEDLDCDCDCR